MPPDRCHRHGSPGGVSSARCHRIAHQPLPAPLSERSAYMPPVSRLGQPGPPSVRPSWSTGLGLEKEASPLSTARPLEPRLDARTP